MKRVIIAVGLVVLVFGSLITFPAHVHWMALVWLLLSLVAYWRDKPIWPWLIAGVLIIAVKRPGFTIEFWILIVAFLAVAFADWRSSRSKATSFNGKRLAIYAVVLLAATTTYGVTRWLAANSSRQIVPDDRPIACLGDSLTDYGYPQELEKRITVPVADFGVNGIKTDDGIKLIPEILAADPQLVIIELGGHDYNADNKPRSATMANLEILIEAFLDQNIAVILVEIPRGFISDPYDGLERELASKYDLQLIDDSVIRNFVYNSPIVPPGSLLDSSRHYSDDGLHPNQSGNKYFADVVSQSLAKVCGGSILR
ncbi:MAG: GDSL-type esterase/lipase family protein [bacterium]|nr:GDSL-type esterase/lipase family protein [bacterium]